MANSIVAGNSTNGGTAITTDTSGTLNIVTGSGSGANAITIDASQNVAMTASQTIAGNLTVTGTITGAGGVSGGIGTDQTWQTVTRASGTTYTNSTNKPIMVSATASTGAVGGVTATAVVAGVTISALYSRDSTGAGAGAGAFFIVPVGATYSITLTGNSPSFNHWKELR